MTTPTIEVSLEEIDRIHDHIMGVIESLDSVGNGNGNVAQVITDAIADLSIVTNSDMFSAAAEAYNSGLNLPWDDEENYGMSDLTGTEVN